MSVPRYRNLRKERHQQQLKDLQIGKQVNSTISRKMHNYEHNIEDDLEEKDERSNYERNEDLNYIRQQIGAKLNKLFSNDHDEVNSFMEYINHNNISIQDFNAVYPELLKNSDPNTNTASYSIPKFQQLLLKDYGNTKETTIMKDIYNLVLKVYESGKLNMTEKDADELIDKAEFYSQTPTSEINDKAKDIISSDESKEDMVVDLVNLFETPLRQKTLDEDWTPVESKSSRRKKKNIEQKQEEYYSQNAPKIDWKMAKNKEELNKLSNAQLEQILKDAGTPVGKKRKDLLTQKVWDLKQII